MSNYNKTNGGMLEASDPSVSVSLSSCKTDCMRFRYFLAHGLKSIGQLTSSGGPRRAARSAPTQGVGLTGLGRPIKRTDPGTPPLAPPRLAFADHAVDGVKQLRMSSCLI